MVWEEEQLDWFTCKHPTFFTTNSKYHGCFLWSFFVTFSCIHDRLCKFSFWNNGHAYKNVRGWPGHFTLSKVSVLIDTTYCRKLCRPNEHSNPPADSLYKLQSLSLCLIWISGKEDPLNEFLDEDQKTKCHFQSCSDSILHVARTPMRRCGWSSKRGSHLSKFRRYEIWKENLLTVLMSKDLFWMTQSHDRKCLKKFCCPWLAGRQAPTSLPVVLIRLQNNHYFLCEIHGGRSESQKAWTCLNFHFSRGLVISPLFHFPFLGPSKKTTLTCWHNFITQKNPTVLQSTNCCAKFIMFASLSVLRIYGKLNM